MVPTDYQAQIVRKLGLRGTLLEQLVLKSGLWNDPERHVDSPSLMRFAVDVDRALATEGWQVRMDCSAVSRSSKGVGVRRDTPRSLHLRELSETSGTAGGNHAYAGS